MSNTARKTTPKTKAGEMKTTKTVEPKGPAEIVELPSKEETTAWVINATKFEKDTEITFQPNPKRKGCASGRRYEQYQTAKTFGEYLDLNEGKFQMADARYDLQKGFLKLTSDIEE